MFLRRMILTPSGLAFCGLSLLYIFSAKGHIEIIDTEYSLRTARAIVNEGSLLIEPVDPALVESAPVVVNGKIYSKYGIGLPLIFIPFVLVAKAMAGITGMPVNEMEGFLISFYNIPFAIGGLYFFYKLSKLLGAEEKHALLGMIILGIGTMYWKYGNYDYSESAQMFFLLGGILFLFRGTNRDLLVSSLLLSCLILIKVVYVVLLPFIFLYLFHKGGGLRKNCLASLLRLGSALLLTGFALAISNYLRFGNPLETGYGKYAMGGWGWKYFRRDIVDIVFSLDRGCYAFNPILFAALPGWFFLGKKQRPVFFLILSISITFFLLMAFRHTWQGGWAWGARTIVPAIPLLWLPFVCAPPSNGWQRATVGILAVLSCYLQTASVCQKTQEYFVIYEQVQSRHPEVQGTMPSQLVGNIILFNHKLLGGSNDGNYLLSLWGADSVAQVSTVEYETFRGFNLWYSHLARRFSQPILHAGAVIFIGSLLGLMVLAIALMRQGNFSRSVKDDRD